MPRCSGMRDLNYVLKVAVALLALCGVTTEVKSTDNEAILALSGVKGYGPESICIQSPGAEGGAYIYAGTALPYQSPTDDDNAFEHVLGDSLEVVFVNHVGRHGARFLSSSKPTDKLTK